MRQLEYFLLQYMVMIGNRLLACSDSGHLVKKIASGCLMLGTVGVLRPPGSHDSHLADHWCTQCKKAIHTIHTRVAKKIKHQCLIMKITGNDSVNWSLLASSKIHFFLLLIFTHSIYPFLDSTGIDPLSSKSKCFSFKFKEMCLFMKISIEEYQRNSCDVPCIRMHLEVMASPSLGFQTLSYFQP